LLFVNYLRIIYKFYITSKKQLDIEIFYIVNYQLTFSIKSFFIKLAHSKSYKMIKNIKDFKNVLAHHEKMTPTQLYFVKGGDGDDKRREDTLRSIISTINTAIATITATIATTTTTTGK